MHRVSRREVEALIEANPEAVNTRDASGKLPLHHAVRNSCVGEGVIETLYATINAMEIDVANYRLFLRHAARLQCRCRSRCERREHCIIIQCVYLVRNSTRKIKQVFHRGLGPIWE